MLQGRLPIRRRGDGQVQYCNAVPGTIWVCPAGVCEDMVHLYGGVRESIHLSFRRGRCRIRPFAKSMSIPTRSACAMTAGFAIP